MKYAFSVERSGGELFWICQSYFDLLNVEWSPELEELVKKDEKDVQYWLVGVLGSFLSNTDMDVLIPKNVLFIGEDKHT